MLTTGYTFTLNPNVKFMPSTLLTYYTGERILYDLNTYFSFFDRFWAGASYRNNRSVTGLFQFHVNEQLKLAYSYDFDIGVLSRYSNGTHGVMLRYEFKYKVDVVGPVGF
jgi:type IX secretion system PorP/SprF family membrane protein